MKVEEFKKIVPKIDKIELKGFEAQSKLAPENRINELALQEDSNTRNASVMALIYPKQDVMHIALILRTQYEGKHSGQVALPGGKQEVFDESHWHTALREVEEEIGVPITEVNLLKELSSLYVPVSKFKVYPFLAESKNELRFTLQTSEVADLIEMPLDYFIFESNIEHITVKTSLSNSLKVPAFVYENHVIWGATAMILSELKVLFIDSMDL